MKNMPMKVIEGPIHIGRPIEQDVIETTTPRTDRANPDKRAINNNTFII